MFARPPRLALVLSFAIATPLYAQPNITSLGSGVPNSVTDNLSGSIYVGGAGLSTTAAARWVLNGGSLSAVEIGGLGSGYVSADGAFQTGLFANAAGPNQVSGYTATGVSPPNSPTPTLVLASGQPATTESCGYRWTAGTSSWQILGGPNGLGGGLAQNVGLPITPSLVAFGSSSSGGSTGSFITPNAISATGRFVVGLGYVCVYNNAGTTISANSFRWRAWIWDAQANGGMGGFTILPTPFKTTSGQTALRRTGNAYAVSSDGLVIVGAQEHNVSGSPAADPDAGRPVVWRWNAGTSSYDMTFLPNGVNGSGFPYSYSTTPGSFAMNAAGTIIAGRAVDNNGNLYIAKWTWNSGTSTWNAPISIGSDLTTPASWLPVAVTSCGVPPNVGSTLAMSDDGNTIVGTATYSTCGSFMSGGFIWRSSTNQIVDWYDYLAGLNTPGVATNGFYGPIGDNGDPARGLPRLGFPVAISPDGNSVVGFQGGTQRIPGAVSWIVNFNGGACVPPLVTQNPNPTTFSACTSAILMSTFAAGTGPFSYQWRKDGQPLTDDGRITGATTYLLRISPPLQTDAGSYDCIITGQCGSPVTTTAALATADAAIPNDTCATALNIGEGTFNYTPCGAYVNDVLTSDCTTSSLALDVWYRYTPSATRIVRIDTCGANYDTVVSVYDDCNGVQLACNDNYTIGTSTGCSSTRSRIDLSVMQGVPVYIKVAAKGFLSSTFTGVLTIAAAPAPAPNDFCANATPAFIETDANTNGNALDTTEATNDATPDCNTNAGMRDVWFSLTPTTCGRVRLVTCPGTTWNTVLSVQDGCPGNQLACNDNINQNVPVPPAITGCTASSQSLIPVLPVAAGQTYYIRVGGNTSTAFGPGRLHVFLLGDYNHDGTLGAADVPLFVSNLLTGTYNFYGDLNGDGAVDGGDVQAMLDCLF